MTICRPSQGNFRARQPGMSGRRPNVSNSQWTYDSPQVAPVLSGLRKDSQLPRVRDPTAVANNANEKAHSA